MVTPGDRSASWLQRDIDGPVTLTLVCCISVAGLVATFGYVAGGAHLAIWLSPIGLLGGSALALRLSKNALMQMWSQLVNRALARCGMVLFVYGAPFWVYVTVRSGIGFAVVLMGVISAMLWFGIGGVTGLIVALSQIVCRCRRSISAAR
jgi:hypothetical protein